MHGLMASAVLYQKVPRTQLQKSPLNHCSFPGLQQQGIFRVPGSQVEVNDIKNSFERGVLLGCAATAGMLCWEQIRLLGVSVCGGCIRHCVKPVLKAFLLRHKELLSPSRYLSVVSPAVVKNLLGKEYEKWG